MAFFMTLCGVCVLYGYNMASFVTLCLFVASFQLSQGSVAWLYIPEVCVDAASGFAAGAQFLNLIVISFTFEFMINSPLKVYGSLWIFAAFSAIGVIYVIFFVKETKGLTDLEKKTLYTPKSSLDQEIMEMQASQKAAEQKK